MKRIFFFSILLFFAIGAIVTSCQKEHATLTPHVPQSPVAKAMSNPQVIDSAVTEFLDGQGSYGVGNDRITSYLWSQISGPASSVILSPSSAYTQVAGLVEGVYQFELKVTDAIGLVSRDTTQVTVNSSLFGHSEIIVNNLVWQRWHQSNVSPSDSSNDEIYLSVPPSSIQTLPTSNFSMWVKKDPLSNWEAVFYSGAYPEPFYYMGISGSGFSIEVFNTGGWIWNLPGQNASVKIRF